MTLPRLCPPSPRKVLAGGRAPACWKQQVRRATAGPAALARACAWVADLAHQPGPKLRREPLLGHCLPELMGELGQEEPPPPAEAERRRAKPTPPREGVGDGLKGQHGPTTGARQPRPPRPDSTAGGRKPSHRPAASAVAGGPKRATPELLARHGGRAAKGRLATADRRRPTAGHRPPMGEHRLLVKQPGHDWSDRLIERVKQRVLRPSPREGSGEGSASLPSHFLPEERPADLAAQWSGLLEGRRIPAGWLAAQLGQVGRGASAGAGSRGGRDEKPSPNPSRGEGGGDRQTAAERRGPGWYSRLRPRRLADGSLLRGTRTGSDAGRGSFASEDANSEGWAGPDEGGATQRNGRLEADDGQVVSVVSRFAPPQMADTLPPLRPPAGPGITAMPAAAAAARRSARREEESAVDDLDELAGKLRRILEEESRRHGIDI